MGMVNVKNQVVDIGWGGGGADGPCLYRTGKISCCVLLFFLI